MSQHWSWSQVSVCFAKWKWRVCKSLWCQTNPTQLLATQTCSVKKVKKSGSDTSASHYDVKPTQLSGSQTCSVKKVKKVNKSEVLYQPTSSCALCKCCKSELGLTILVIQCNVESKVQCNVKSLWFVTEWVSWVLNRGCCESERSLGESTSNYRLGNYLLSIKWPIQLGREIFLGNNYERDWGQSSIKGAVTQRWVNIQLQVGNYLTAVPLNCTCWILIRLSLFNSLKLYTFGFFS